MRYAQVQELRQQRLAQCLVRTTRGQVRVGRHWRKDTWEVIIFALQDVGAGMREGGPIASVYYATVLDVAIEYLIAKPNRERAYELGALLSVDFASFFKYYPRFRDGAFNPTEKRLLAQARVTFATAVLRMQLLCPDTT